jgi:hypothetical protein
MAITWKQFCFGLGCGVMVAWLGSCGGDGAKDATALVTTPASIPLAVPSCHDTAIAGNHGHELSIPSADLNATVTRTYDITGTGDHSHIVSLTATQLGLLKAGASLTITSGNSSNTPTHTHQISVACV